MPVWTQEATTVPVDISHPVLIGLSGKKVFSAQIGMLLAEGNHQFEESQQPSVFLDQPPIDPTDRVILTIRIVIASLGASYFISGQDHGDAFREHENSEEILDLLLSQCLNCWIARLPLHTTIPTAIRIAAISIPFPVSFIVFVIIRYQIIQGKSIMAGDEIDTVYWLTLCLLVEVRAPCNACSGGTYHPRVASDKAADHITVAPVPFRPAIYRKVANLIETSRILRLNKEFGIG
jgi:hypothetical protein